MVVAAGDPVYASDINAIIAATTGKPLVRLVQQTSQNLAAGAATPLTFGAGSTAIDTHTFHSESVNTSRVTPTIAGYYRCTATASFTSAAYSQIAAAVAKNGTRQAPQEIMRPDPAAAASSSQTTAELTANGTTDYFEAYGIQSSTGAQNTNTSSGFQSTFEVEFLRPL
jgi:hypothetical protein